MEAITWIALLVIIGILLNTIHDFKRKLDEMHNLMFLNHGKLNEMTEYQSQLGRLMGEDVRMHVYLLNEDRAEKGKEPIRVTH